MDAGSIVALAKAALRNRGIDPGTSDIVLNVVEKCGKRRIIDSGDQVALSKVTGVLEKWHDVVIPAPIRKQRRLELQLGAITHSWDYFLTEVRKRVVGT